MRVRHDAYVRNGKVIIGYAEAIGEGGHTLRVSGETVSTVAHVLHNCTRKSDLTF